jgi:hypothetical protein
MCLCEESCSAWYAAIGFEYDGHKFCEGECADNARATLAEDIAREMAHDRGDVCALKDCAFCRDLDGMTRGVTS